MASNSHEYWVDCGAFFLESAAVDGQSVQVSQPTTTETAPTKDARVATPDVRDGGPASPSPTRTRASSMTSTPLTEMKCEQNGISYYIVPGSGCSDYKMKWGASLKSEAQFACPPHTRFSIEDCTCAHADCPIP